MSRRKLRNLPRISYCEPEEPNLDEYVYCDKCGDDVYEYCSIHGPLLVIPDDKVPPHPPYPPFVPRAALTIPKQFLHLNYSSIPGAGLGVFATLTLPSGVRFGPYRGIKTKDVDSDYCWQIYDNSRRARHVVDARAGAAANWMRYVNCARHCSELNLLAYQFRGELYYRTLKIIPRFTELLVFYGTEYALKLDIDIKRFNSPKHFIKKIAAPPPKKQKIAIEERKHQDCVLKPRKNKETNNLVTEHCPNSVAIQSNKFETNAAQENCVQVEQTNKKIYDNPLQNNEILSIKNDRYIIKKENKCRGTKVSNNRNTLVKLTPKRPQNKRDNTKSVKNKNLNHNNELGKDINANKTPILASNKDQNCIDIITKNLHCSFCNYKSLIKDMLEKHMRFHDPNRQHVCQTCQYRFESSLCLKKHLQNHIRTHTGEKPYACDICDYRCSQATHLKTHIRTHTGEKPYACDICDYRCSQATHLKTHMRTHTGEKPYACDICDYKCSHIGTLINHLKKHLNVSNT